MRSVLGLIAIAVFAYLGAALFRIARMPAAVESLLTMALVAAGIGLLPFSLPGLPGWLAVILLAAIGSTSSPTIAAQVALDTRGTRTSQNASSRFSTFPRPGPHRERSCLLALHCTLISDEASVSLMLAERVGGIFREGAGKELIDSGALRAAFIEA